MIELTKQPLFDPLTSLDTDEGYIDLHNDYKCQNITLENQCLKINFGGKNEVVIEFLNVEITKLHWLFSQTPDSKTLDNFYRGRFEKSGSLHEFSESGKGYFYLDFYEDDCLELFADSVFLTVKNKD
jgi:hypothetical protein